MPRSPQSSDTRAPAEDTNVPNTELSANTRVLGLPELLQLILLRVPVQNLTALRRVARLWNDVTLDINHVDPISIGHGDNCCRCLCGDACVHTPHYTSRFAIRGNPVFTYTHIYRAATRDRNGNWTIADTMRHYRGLALNRWLDHDSDLDLDAIADQFITDPPITLVALSDHSLHVQAMLRVPTGIRVGDIQDVFAKMYAANDDDAKGQAAWPTAWYGCFSDIVRSTDAGSMGNEDDIGTKLAVLSLAT